MGRPRKRGEQQVIRSLLKLRMLMLMSACQRRLPRHTWVGAKTRSQDVPVASCLLASKLQARSNFQHLSYSRCFSLKSWCEVYALQREMIASVQHRAWGKPQRTIWLGEKPARRGGTWGVGCHFCAHLMSKLSNDPEQRRNLFLGFC